MRYLKPQAHVTVFPAVWSSITEPDAWVGLELGMEGSNGTMVGKRHTPAMISHPLLFPQDTLLCCLPTFHTLFSTDWTSWSLKYSTSRMQWKFQMDYMHGSIVFLLKISHHHATLVKKGRVLNKPVYVYLPFALVNKNGYHVYVIIIIIWLRWNSLFSNNDVDIGASFCCYLTSFLESPICLRQTHASIRSWNTWRKHYPKLSCKVCVTLSVDYLFWHILLRKL